MDLALQWLMEFSGGCLDFGVCLAPVGILQDLGTGAASQRAGTEVPELHPDLVGHQILVWHPNLMGCGYQTFIPA